jgi:PAS domain S-box-containing protein
MITFQSIPDAFPIGIAAVFSCALVVFAWRRRAMPMASAFATMMAGETIWALGAALEPIIIELPIKRLCIDLRILGTITAILGLLAFVFRYTGMFRWLTTRQFAMICAPAIPLIVLAWTDPFHHLYFAQLLNEKVGESWIAIRSFGPGFWGMLAYCYALVAVSTVLLAQAVSRSTGVYRAQAAAMLFGVLLPWVVDIIDMSGMVRFIPVDLVSPTFALTGLSLLPALFRFHLLDLPPIAWAVVVTGMDDPVVVIDPSGRIVVMNPAAERLIGRKSLEVTGVEAARAFSHWPSLAERLRRVDGREERTKLAGPDPDRASSFDARVSPLGDDVHRSGWVLVLRDVSELTRVEEERVQLLHEQRARAEAEGANRAKDRFLATLSHELRTPLTPILATVTAMLDDLATPDAFRNVLEMIHRNVALEARLIDDLLDMTRIRNGKLRLERKVVDVHQLVHQVVEICQEDLRSARVELALDLTARRHNLDADPIRLQQVLWNLVKNAIKFTPPGGIVTVRSRVADGGPQNPTEARLILEVSDTGIGIEPDALPRIFDAFQQENLSSSWRLGGLGLGLMISRSIVEQHRGHLSAASGGKNLGAVFRIEMPSFIALTIDDRPDEPLPSSVVIPRQTLSILLVEDNADTLNFLSKMLTLRGNKVYTANSLVSAVRVASEVEFDVLISDIELPDGSGLELLWTLRASREVPGIALSGFGSSEDIELSHSAGFAKHLTKPVDFKMLEKAIHQVAARHRIDGLVKVDKQ